MRLLVTITLVLVVMFPALAQASLTSTFSGGFSAVSGCKVFVLSNRSSQGQNSDEYE